MIRIHPVSLNEADPDTRQTLEAVKAKVGMIPNLYATFARSPATLQGFLSLSEQLSQGQLSPAQRETIALAVGQTNQCQYCLSAHTLLGKAAGLTEQQCHSARAGDDALARFAARLVDQRGLISDDDLGTIKALGFDDGQIVEIVANVAMNILTNYTNHVAATDIDFPAVDLAL